jgi:purine-nucleoside phosphorylase
VTASLYDRALETANWLKERANGQPVLGLILGSGLGDLADSLTDAVVIPFHEIPHFPVSAVEGHAGNIVMGTFSGKYVVFMQGRVHYYEGWSPEEVTFGVRVLKLMGIDRAIITTSAGGVNRDFEPGDLMLITDHLNFTGYVPLRGENDERFGPRFPDMSHAYDPWMRQKIIEAARELNIPLKSGVYAGFAGPCYETPAEIRMIGVVGGDAVGMSTVPETIVANHMGMKVGGISCISNLAAGISPTKLSHGEVKATANMVRETFGALISRTVELL